MADIVLGKRRRIVSYQLIKIRMEVLLPSSGVTMEAVRFSKL